MRPSQKPHANYYSQGVYGTYRLRVFDTTQPQQLHTNYGTFPRISSWNRKVSTKPITFQKIHGRGRITKKQIITAVQPVFLSPLVDQLTSFGKVSALQMLQHLLPFYGKIYKIDPEENIVKKMGPYDPVEPLNRLINKFEKEEKICTCRRAEDF